MVCSDTILTAVFFLVKGSALNRRRVLVPLRVGCGALSDPFWAPRPRHGAGGADCCGSRPRSEARLWAPSTHTPTHRDIPPSDALGTRPLPSVQLPEQWLASDPSISCDGPQYWAYFHTALPIFIAYGAFFLFAPVLTVAGVRSCLGVKVCAVRPLTFCGREVHSLTRGSGVVATAP